MRLTAMAPAEFEVVVLPSTAPEPLVVRWSVDGEPFERTIDLASRLEDVIARRSRLEKVSDAGPAPDPRVLAEADSARAAFAAKGVDTKVIFFSGRLVYTRPGDATHPTEDVGAAGVRVSLMDQDPGPDDELASTFTGYDGSFYYWASWDGQVLEGDPELYVKFETDHPWVVVQEGFWDIEYSWTTATQGSSTADLNVGTFRPSDSSTHPALHIASSIAKAHIWTHEHTGHLLDEVDVKWPDGDNAYYDPFWGQIHISHAREWEEKVAVHEYGHFLVDQIAADEDPSCCNGYCDQGSCGHCSWCEEGTNEAFSEGWPDWYSTVVIRDFPDYGGVPALYQYDWESVKSCNGPLFTDASKTEGNFAAILWDIFDDGPGADDTDPSGFGWRDRMALGHDEIFQVLDLDEPTNSRSFLTAFAYRYPQYRTSVWEVGMNNRWDLD